MVEYESIAQMMQFSANAAIQSAKERFGFHLDYSEATLEPLETILINVTANLPADAADKIEYETKLWGSYFGEVIRQRWEGAWELSQYPGSALMVPAITIQGGLQLYPLMKVYRRITLGDAENLWQYYQKIRQKLVLVHPSDAPSV